MKIDVKRNRIRFKLKMNSKLPVLSIHKTNKYFFAQLVNYHEDGKVLAAVHEKTFTKDNKQDKKKPVEIVEKMGEVFGKELLGKGFESIAYDRSGYIYHGKVKAFCEGLRKAGLKL